VRRRERKRRLIRLGVTAVVVAAMGVFFGIETMARSSYIATRSLISRERLIEQGQYQEAIHLWNAMRAEHQFTLTALFDVPQQIADLEERVQEDKGAGAAGAGAGSPKPRQKTGAGRR